MINNKIVQVFGHEDVRKLRAVVANQVPSDYCPIALYYRAIKLWNLKTISLQIN